MNALFEQILREDKSSRIKKLDMTDTMKRQVTEFFKEHPNLEKEIDWNKKDLGWDDFYPIMMKNLNSKSNKKVAIKKDLSKQFDPVKDDVEIWYNDNKYIFASPLTHDACVFMDSFECFGSGAKWCIGTENNPEYWRSYTLDGSAFIFLYNAETKQKFMIERGGEDNYKVWNAEDDDIVRWESWDRVAEETMVHLDPKIVYNLTSDWNDRIDDIFMDIKFREQSDAVAEWEEESESYISDLNSCTFEEPLRLWDHLYNDLENKLKSSNTDFDEEVDYVGDLASHLATISLQHFKQLYKDNKEIGATEDYLDELCAVEAGYKYDNYDGECQGAWKKQLSQLSAEIEKSYGQQFLNFDESTKRIFNRILNG